MTKEQKSNLGKLATELGYKQSAYDSNRMYKGSSQLSWTPNGLNNDGNRRDTYSVAKNYLEKKKG